MCQECACGLLAEILLKIIQVYLFFHAINLRIPSLKEVFGWYPNKLCALDMSETVLSTSPGCIGS